MTTRDLTKMALFVALLCVSAYIAVPIPISPAPIVATTLVLSLMAYLLTPKQTFITILVYLLIGAIGIPVFSSGSAGFGKLLGPTGGYLFGYLVAFPILSYCRGTQRSVIRYIITGIVITIPIVYIGGIATLMMGLHWPLDKALYAGALPFIPGDILKIVIAAWMATKIRI